MGFWDYMFHWYTGALWSNLIASALWSIPSIWYIVRKVRKHNESLRAHLQANHETLMQHYAGEVREFFGVEDSSSKDNPTSQDDHQSRD